MQNIHDALSRNLCAHGDGRGVGVELEMRYGVGVGSKDDLATRINGEVGEVGVEVLAARETVDLDRHAGIGAGRKHRFPPSLETRAMMEVSPPGMGKDVHFGCVDGAQETLGLIAVRVEMAVDGGDNAVDLEALALGYIEGAIDQDLDLEPLEKSVFLAVLIIPALDSPALETDPFPIEPGCDLETARVVGDHRPGITAATTRPSHGLERCLAVGVSGVPMAGSAQPLRAEIRRT